MSLSCTNALSYERPYPPLMHPYMSGKVPGVNKPIVLVLYVTANASGKTDDVWDKRKCSTTSQAIPVDHRTHTTTIIEHSELSLAILTTFYTKYNKHNGSPSRPLRELDQGLGQAP